MTYEATQWVQAEALFLEWEIPYELVAALPLSDIKTEDYSQVRSTAHRAPASNVERYTLMMKNGATFPPIVVAANDKAIIDGNTRYAAAKRSGLDAIPAYIVNPAHASTARRIGAALNQLNGEALTDDELQAVARDFLEDNVPDAEIARRLGRTPEWARRFRKREDFTSRVGKHESAKSISNPVREKLSDISLDAPLKRVMDAAKTLKIDRVAADRLVKAAQSERSEQGAVAAVEQVLAEIAPTQQAGHAKTTPAADRLKRVVTRLEDAVTALEAIDVPLVQPRANEYRERLTACISKISGLVARLPADTEAPDEMEPLAS